MLRIVVALTLVLINESAMSQTLCNTDFPNICRIQGSYILGTEDQPECDPIDLAGNQMDQDIQQTMAAAFALAPKRSGRSLQLKVYIHT
jgi:hypothetical protein